MLTWLGRSDVRYKDGSYLGFYLCHCGVKCLRRVYSVKKGVTTSCGCYKKSGVAIREALKGKLPKNACKDLDESNRNLVYHTYKKSAEKRRLLFELTMEQFVTLVKSNCHYCSKPPSQIKARKGTRAPFIYNGIDRKDNGGGYILSNCVPCCKICNYAKHTMTYTQFLEFIGVVYKTLALRLDKALV